MNVTIAGIGFDHHDYDERGDTLWLHVGPPRAPARALETPEGHVVEYDEVGTVIGLELLNVRRTLERDGAITLSWPKAELSGGPARFGACGGVTTAGRSGSTPRPTAGPSTPRAPQTFMEILAA